MAPTIGPKKQARLQKLASAFDPAKVQEQVQVAKDYKDAMTKAGYSISSAAQFDNLLENTTLRHQWLGEQLEKGNEELKIQEEEIELAREDVQEFEKFFQAYSDVIEEWDIKDEKTEFLALVEESRAFDDVVTQVKGLLVRFPNLAARISTSPEIKQAVEAALKDERVSLDELKQQFYDIDQRALDRVAQKFDELNLEQRLEDRVSSIQELLDAANVRQSEHHSMMLRMQSDHTTLQVEKQVVQTELTETAAQLADANEAKDEANKRSDLLQDQVTSLSLDNTNLKNEVAQLNARLVMFQASLPQGDEGQSVSDRFEKVQSLLDGVKKEVSKLQQRFHVPSPLLSRLEKRPSELSLPETEARRRRVSGRGEDTESPGSQQHGSPSRPESPLAFRSSRREPSGTPQTATVAVEAAKDRLAPPEGALRPIWQQIQLRGLWTDDQCRQLLAFLQESANKKVSRYQPVASLDQCANQERPYCFVSYMRREQIRVPDPRYQCPNCNQPQRELCLHVKFVGENLGAYDESSTDLRWALEIRPRKP
ncbi:MAG: hypothetical protein Q9192_006430 [Flavoplaca navasiana]